MKKLIAVALLAVPLTFAMPDQTAPADSTTPAKHKKHGKKHKKDANDTTAPTSK